MRVCIVGASSGIGEQCAVEFARHGEKLILSARREDELERVRKRCMEAGAAQAEVLPLDLADTASLEAMADSAWNTYGGLDILLCNAGISQRCDTDETGVEIIRKVMEIDYFAPVIVTKRILSHMLRSGGGRLACTGSIAGLFGSRQIGSVCRTRLQRALQFLERRLQLYPAVGGKAHGIQSVIYLHVLCDLVRIQLS